jgi:polyisoprenoid-binding protein YceI
MRKLRLGRLPAVGMALAVLVLLPLAAAADARAPGEITFVGANKVATANGTFRSWKVTTAEINEADPGKSRVELEVDLASIDTANDKRDKHLRNADFFDVEKYPTAHVLIEGAKLAGEDVFAADVTMDLHGVKKTFPVKFRIEDRKARKISAAFTINRMDFGIGEPYSMLNPLSIEEEIPVRVTATIPPAS